MSFPITTTAEQDVADVMVGTEGGALLRCMTTDLTDISIKVNRMSQCNIALG